MSDMANELERELFRALRESQNKYTYFLLAAGGAAIGFAITQTNDAVLAISHIPLGFAILSWGGSFWCGCHQLEYVSSMLYANAEMLRIESGQHPDIPPHPDYIAAASQGVRAAIEHNSNRTNALAHWQFRLFIAGAALYIGWHILAMYLRALEYGAVQNLSGH